MKSKSRSKPAAASYKITSSTSSSDYSSESPKKGGGGGGLDVFEFDEYDGFDDTRFNKLLVTNNTISKWNLNKHTTSPPSPPPTKRRLQTNDDDDGFDMPLSTFTQNYRSSSNKRQNQTQTNKPDDDEPTTPHTKNNLTQDIQNQKQETKSTGGYKIYKRTKKKSAVSNNSKDSTREVVKKPTQNVTPLSVNKLKKGNNDAVSEKQMLRDRIKSMLLDAGWTIEYRPRKNRASKDAVYITPTGTGYWSIVKAYDAFQKMKVDDSKHGPEFTPLPDEVLGKLMRPTQEKMERQTNNKRKNEVAEDDDTDEKTTRKSRKLGTCTLLVRGSDKGVNSANGFQLYSGKRSILSWLIDSRVVDVSEHVEYINTRKTRTMQKGSITKDGILCGCCSKIVTFSKFEEHSGSKLGDPFPNIFLKSGKSLMRCQIDAWEKLGELEKTGFYTVDVDGDDPNDDTCGLCGDGGDLICCDGCPSTFHQSCLDLEMLPEGDWHCPNCPCKYCETVSGKTEESLLMCGLCQKKYHESCRPQLDVKPMEKSYLNLAFCGHKCHELYSQLQKQVGVKHKLDSGFSWSLVHRSDILTDASSVQLSRGVESNSILAVAMSVMDECFLPVNDRKSKTNLIRNVVFNCGSNLSRLNYSGFFTAILERGDEVVCAASIRIHGTQLAEMPFIGTRHVHRRQGMCRRLLSAIESALSSLHVEKLIIPAVAEHMTTWTDVFGFRPLEESHKQEMRCLNMLVFPGTDMLQKPLVKQETLPEGNNSVLVDDVEKSELMSSDVKDSSDKTATDSGSQEPGDHGCIVDANKETLPSNSPVKDEMPVPVVAANSSEMVSSIKIADDADSRSAQILTVASCDTVSSNTPCEPKVLVSVDPHVSSNVEETSTAKATNVPDVSSNVEETSTAKATDVPGVSSNVEDTSSAKATDVHGVSSNVEDTSSAKATDIPDVFSNMKETTTAKAIDVRDVSSDVEETSTAKATDVHGVSSNVEDTSSAKATDIPDVSSNVEETTTAKATDVPDVSSNVEDTSTAKATDVPAVSSNAEETSTAKATDVPAVSSNAEETTTAKATDVSSNVEETGTAKATDVPDVSSNVKETSTAKATNVLDVPSSNIISSATPCELELQIPANEPVSTNLNSDTNVGELAMQNGNETNVKAIFMVEKLDMQNGCDITTDNVSLEVQSPPQVASNNNVSSDAPCEQESPSLVSHMPVTVEESSADVILETGIHAVKDNVKLSEGKNGLYESETIAQETV